MGEPLPWFEALADSWDRIAVSIEQPPQNGRADPLVAKVTNLHPRSVAATARALATGLRIAGRRASREEPAPQRLDTDPDAPDHAGRSQHQESARCPVKHPSFLHRE